MEARQGANAGARIGERAGCNCVIRPLTSPLTQEPSPGRVKSTDAAVSEWSRALRGTKSAQVSL